MAKHSRDSASRSRSRSRSKSRLVIWVTPNFAAELYTSLHGAEAGAATGRSHLHGKGTPKGEHLESHRICC